MNRVKSIPAASLTRATFLLFLFLLPAFSLWGCGTKEDVTIAATSTYSFDLCTDAADEAIHLEHWADEMRFQLDTSAINERYTFLLFLDYEQVPFYINGVAYEQYEIHVQEETDSHSFSFRLAQEPDSEQIHRLTGIIADHPDVHLAEEKSLDFLDDRSLTASRSLVIGDAQISAFPETAAVQPEQLYDSPSADVLINCHTDKLERYVPDKEVFVKKGEPLTIQYHAGGYPSSTSLLLLATAGFQQMELDGQPYLYFDALPAGQTAAGYAQMQTPGEPGSYEVIVYLFPDPFTDRSSDLSAQSSFRFTLTVEDQ